MKIAQVIKSRQPDPTPAPIVNPVAQAVKKCIGEMQSVAQEKLMLEKQNEGTTQEAN